MNGEAIFNMIIMVGVGFGCGAVFFCIGAWAAKRSDPMPFWSGSVVDPAEISDIPAYNRENARMWKFYSVPYWLTGALSVLNLFGIEISSFGIIPLIIAGTVGIIWLIWKYKRIYKKYKIEQIA